MSAFGPIWDTPFGTAGRPDDRARSGRRGAGGLRRWPLPGSASSWAISAQPTELPGGAALALFCAALWPIWRRPPGYAWSPHSSRRFVYTGATNRPGDAYALGAFRPRRPDFSRTFIGALRTAGVAPNSFPGRVWSLASSRSQLRPPRLLAAADQAVITREIARATAHQVGTSRDTLCRAGSGVGGQRRAYPHEPPRRCRPSGDPLAGGTPLGLSLARGALLRWRSAPPAGHLCGHRAVAGFLPQAHAQSLGAHGDRPAAAGSRRRACAFAQLPQPRRRRRAHGSSMSSFDPLTPLPAPIWRWARSCTPGWTGFVAGYRGLISETRLDRRFLRSLPEALDSLSGNESARDWLGPVHLDAYLRHKRAEVAHVGGSLPGRTLRSARRKFTEPERHPGASFAAVSRTAMTVTAEPNRLSAARK